MRRRMMLRRVLTLVVLAAVVLPCRSASRPSPPNASTVGHYACTWLGALSCKFSY